MFAARKDTLLSGDVSTTTCRTVIARPRGVSAKPICEAPSTEIGRACVRIASEVKTRGQRGRRGKGGRRGREART
jgi:hypothetical protein